MPQKILIIEDMFEYAEEVKILLEEEGFEADFALTGEEGLEKAVEMRPDLILLDLILPGIDGFEVYDRIKKHPDIKNTRVVALSSIDNPEQVKRMLDKGVDEYILKISTPEILIERVRSNLPGV